MQKLRCDDEIERAGRKRQRAGVRLNDVDVGKIGASLRGNSRRHRVGFQADDFSANTTATQLRQHHRWDIGAAGADIEQRDTLQRCAPKNMIQCHHDAPRAVQVAIENSQIAQIARQQVRVVTGNIHQLFFVTTNQSRSPRAITKAEFFEPKPMHLHNEISADLAMLRFGM